MLTEVDRLGIQVDLVTYEPRPGEKRQVVFKYYFAVSNVANFWHEANCVMRMPPHPPTLSCLILSSSTQIGVVDVVVGFATRYIPAGTLAENNDRVFKLKYLEQLIDVSTNFLSPSNGSCVIRPSDLTTLTNSSTLDNRLLIISISV